MKNVPYMAGVVVVDPSVTGHPLINLVDHINDLLRADKSLVLFK